MAKLVWGILAVLALWGCAERPLIGVTISNSPDQRGACIPSRPGGGC